MEQILIDSLHVSAPLMTDEACLDLQLSDRKTQLDNLYANPNDLLSALREAFGDDGAGIKN